MTVKKQIKILYIVIPVFVALFATGCGNNATARSVPKISKLSEFDKASSASVSDEASGKRGCAAQAPNVAPAYPNGAPDYQVCMLENDSFGIELYIDQDEEDELSRTLASSSGTSTLPSEICAFPLQVYDADYQRGLAERVIWKMDNAGLPMVACSKLTPGGKVSFKNTYYNGVYVVDARKMTQMRQCLVAQNEYLCPPFARGKFRNQ